MYIYRGVCVGGVTGSCLDHRDVRCEGGGGGGGGLRVLALITGMSGVTKILSRMRLLAIVILLKSAKLAVDTFYII